MAGAAVPMYNITACRIDLRANICSGSSMGLQRIRVQTLGIFGVSLPSLCTSAHLDVFVTDLCTPKWDPCIRVEYL